jgi:peroxiredoxin
MTLIIFGMVLPWLLVAVGCWLGYQLMRQNGRILLQLESLSQRLGHAHGTGPTPELPLGSVAPAFELPDLEGVRHALAEFRGQRVLLIFFNPGCGFCVKMAPDLAALPVDGSHGRPVPVVVTTGEVERNRQLIEEQGLRCPVLVQEKMEVTATYQVPGTPAGYLIDEQGAIASKLAVGADALFTLAVAPSVEPIEAEIPEPGGNGHRPQGKANKGLAASRLTRDGLKAGTPAPGFRLPRLDEGELSLEAYRGRRVLLVFSDPECVPCDQLLPHLERLHHERRDLQVLMVGRRDVEANREKVAKLGLTFPVVLQKSWEVSLQYGIFATPVGYLIDEDGTIAADVAKGVEPILALVSGAAVTDNGKVEHLALERR